MNTPARQDTLVDFSFLRQSVVSRERVVPTEWQVRTVLGDCMSRAKVIPTQAPPYRQYAHLSMREEAALATNWINDRPEGLKLQNLALATMTGPVMSSSPKNLTADVQHAMNKCETFGLRETIDPSRESIGNRKGFFSRIWQSFDVFFFFAECVFPVLHVTSGHPR